LSEIGIYRQGIGMAGWLCYSIRNETFVLLDTTWS